MKLGYAKETDRLAIKPQIKALRNAGVERLFMDGHLFEFVAAIRRGDDALVCRVSVLGKRRVDLDDVCGTILGKGATIIELETGRTSADPAEWHAALMDAINELAGKRVFNPGTPGRPVKRTLTQLEQAKAEAEWFKAHDSNETRVHAVLKAIGEPFDYHFGYRLFGKPSAKP